MQPTAQAVGGKWKFKQAPMGRKRSDEADSKETGQAPSLHELLWVAGYCSHPQHIILILILVLDPRRIQLTRHGLHHL